MEVLFGLDRKGLEVWREPDARRYAYAPTFILRGLNKLHLEFTPAG